MASKKFEFSVYNLNYEHFFLTYQLILEVFICLLFVKVFKKKYVL